MYITSVLFLLKSYHGTLYIHVIMRPNVCLKNHFTVVI